MKATSTETTARTAPVVRLRVGNAEIVGLVDRVHEFNPAWHFPDIAAEAWAPYRELLTAEGDWLLNFRSYLVRADSQVVLIDTGWGPEAAPPGVPATPAGLLDGLASVGVGVDDVDIVVFTHLHPDHVGWNLVREGTGLRPRFRRARYLVPEGDWEHYRVREEMHPSIRAQALPLDNLGVMELINGDHSVTSSLMSLSTPGHTPGHLSFVLSSATYHCFVLGDLAHHPVIAEETDWVQRFDWEPTRAVQTRRAVLQRLERDGTMVAAGHFPAPGFGRFVRRDGRRTWQPL